MNCNTINIQEVIMNALTSVTEMENISPEGRNKAARNRALFILGEKWVLHPKNKVQRKTPFTQTAESLRRNLGTPLSYAH